MADLSEQFKRVLGKRLILATDEGEGTYNVTLTFETGEKIQIRFYEGFSYSENTVDSAYIEIEHKEAPSPKVSLTLTDEEVNYILDDARG